MQVTYPYPVWMNNNKVITRELSPLESLNTFAWIGLRYIYSKKSMYFPYLKHAIWMYISITRVIQSFSVYYIAERKTRRIRAGKYDFLIHLKSQKDKANHVGDTPVAIKYLARQVLLETRDNFVSLFKDAHWETDHHTSSHQRERRSITAATSLITFASLP